MTRTPRGFSKDELAYFLAIGNERYDGRLKPHLKVILYMWNQGYSNSDIGTHLQLACGVRLTGFWSHYSSLASLVAYAVSRSTAKTILKGATKVSIRFYDVLPTDIADAQMAWDRRHTALRMSVLGLTQKEIGKRLGDITASRISQIIRQAKRNIQLQSRPPIEIYLSQPFSLNSIGHLGRRAIADLIGPDARDWLILSTMHS